MSDDSIDSFLVEIGFQKPDAAAARAVEDLVNRTETRITDVQARESAKRAETETKAASDGLSRFKAMLDARNEAEAKSKERRRDAFIQVTSEMLGFDKEQFAASLKHAKENAGKTVEVEHERAKKLTAIRTEQFKGAEAGLLRFAGVVGAVGTGLGAALSAAPFGAFLMGVERTASGLSNLAIQSQRVGSTAGGISRFVFAMKQQGVDEGEANGALEGIAAKMKSNPEGYRQALEGLPGGGVRTLGKDGKPLTYEEMLENLGPYLAKQPYNIAKIQAGEFGITGDNALNALRNPAETRRGLNAYDAKLSAFGIDPNKAAEDARKVQRAYDNLSTDLALIHQKIDTQFFVPLMDAFDGMAKWVEEHPDVVEPLEKGLVAFAGVMSLRVLPVVGNLLKVLTGLGSVTLSPAILAAIGVGGAKYLADNTMSNVDPWRDQSTGETALRAIDPGLADRTYGKRGEQLPHGPHHGLGTHATPHDDRNLWQRTMPKALGGKDAPEGAPPKLSPIERLRRAARGPGKGGDATHVDPNGSRTGGRGNANMNPENAAAIVSAAKDLGTTSEDLATVIGYETAGTYSPSKWGGSGGNYMGLIQFGPPERKQYGANDRQTFPEQMGAVKRYLKDRGFKPGMGLLDLYSTINAGSPGHYGASDGNGTVRTHVAKMQKEIAPTARAFVAMAGKPMPYANAAATAPYHPDDDRASRARASDVPYGARGHLSPIQYTHARPANPLADLYKDGFLKVEVAKPIPGISDLKRTQEHIARLHKDGLLMPKLDHRALIASSLTHSVRHGNVHHERHGDTFHVHGTDAKTGLNEAAKVSARRESQDRVRYGQG